MMKRQPHVWIFALSVAALSISAKTATSQDAARWQPIDPPMLTRWAADIDPASPLPEYPRPQMTRAD